VLLGLTTGHKVGLALAAAVFIAFALLSALVIPRWRPDFPGSRGRNWFIVATIALFVAMLFAVELFGAEEKEAKGEPAGGVTTTTPAETKPAAPQAPAGNPAEGKAVFASQGCGACHTFQAAGSTGTVGPDLDEALKGKDAAFVRESIVDPNKVIAKGFQAGVMPQSFGQTLSSKQLDDLVAFLTKG
jgi:mono/diheme cytochrome c family protein